ncbi:hypothetical protein JCM14076_26270 [Methylosoma difficile]
MAHPSPRTPKTKRTNIANSRDAQEDDFILADLQTTTDDSQLKITPLTHWQDDEDAIDRLLVNTGFEETTDAHQDAWTDMTVDSSETLVDIGNANGEGMAAAVIAKEVAEDLPAVEPFVDLFHDEGFVVDVVDVPVVDDDYPQVELVALEPDLMAEPVLVRESAAVLEPIKAGQPAEELFEVDAFISSYISERSEPEQLEEPVSPVVAAPLLDVPAPEVVVIPEDKSEPEPVKQAEQPSFVETVAPVLLSALPTEPVGLAARSKPVPASTIALPIWALAVLLGVMALLAATSVSLVFSMAGMKKELSHLSAILDVVKDDVEVLSQK